MNLYFGLIIDDNGDPKIVAAEDNDSDVRTELLAYRKLQYRPRIQMVDMNTGIGDKPTNPFGYEVAHVIDPVSRDVFAILIEWFQEKSTEWYRADVNGTILKSTTRDRLIQKIALELADRMA